MIYKIWILELENPIGSYARLIDISFDKQELVDIAERDFYACLPFTTEIKNYWIQNDKWETLTVANNMVSDLHKLSGVNFKFYLSSRDNVFK